MKKLKYFILAAIIVVAFSILYSASDEEFLSFLKYQSVGELKSERFYWIRLLSAPDSSYYFKATSSGHNFRVLKRWFEEEYEQISNTDGFVLFNEHDHVIYYDSTKVKFLRNQLVLISPGITKIITQISTQIDTFGIEIVRRNKGLRINKIF